MKAGESEFDIGDPSSRMTIVCRLPAVQLPLLDVDV